MAIQSMFGRKPDPATLPTYTSPGADPGNPSPYDFTARLDATLPVDPLAGQRPVNPSFFERGGMGGKMLMGAAGGALDGIAHFGGLEGGYVAGMQANQKAMLEQQQRVALERIKRENPEPTALQRNAEYLGSRNPAWRETYERAQANPVTLMSDPETGQVGFYPKGGIAPPSDATPVVTVKTVEEARQLPPGTHFRGADGVVRVR